MECPDSVVAAVFRIIQSCNSGEENIVVEIIPVGLIKEKFEGKIPHHVAAAGLTVQELLSRLPIQTDLVAFIVVNGRLVSRDHRLSDNDVIKLVPMVGGG
ncbi:MAG: MoaD/ThiS family protein [Chloroflexota bacterium]|nr:MoaD/ThiS family protein [Anaerolineae bacterium]